MLFALGYIAGVATCAFIAVVLAYFKRPIISTLTKVEAEAIRRGPNGQGFIFEPPSDADTVREARIRENAEKGRDTPIEELQ